MKCQCARLREKSEMGKMKIYLIFVIKCSLFHYYFFVQKFAKYTESCKARRFQTLKRLLFS